jgi:hypothetical protein
VQPLCALQTLYRRSAAARRGGVARTGAQQPQSSLLPGRASRCICLFAHGGCSRLEQAHGVSIARR